MAKDRHINWMSAEIISAWSREQLDRLLKDRELWDGPFDRELPEVFTGERRRQWYAYVAPRKDPA